MKRIRLELDRAAVVKLYEKHKNLSAVADSLGAWPNAVAYHLRLAGVEIVRKPKQRRWLGERIEQVRKVLTRWGALTVAELTEEMTAAGFPIIERTLLNHITRWRKQHGSKWIRIAAWEMSEDGSRRRPVYALGPGSDVKYQKQTAKQCMDRHRRKYAALQKACARKTPATPWTGLVQ